MSAAPQEKTVLGAGRLLPVKRDRPFGESLEVTPDRIFLLETEPTFTTCLIFTKIGVLYYSRLLPSEVLLIIDLHAKLNSIIA